MSKVKMLPISLVVYESDICDPIMFTNENETWKRRITYSTTAKNFMFAKCCLDQEDGTSVFYTSAFTRDEIKVAMDNAEEYERRSHERVLAKSV